MSKDPFWTKKVIDRKLVKSPQNFPALKEKLDLEAPVNNTKKGDLDYQDFPDKFYEGFYFRGKDFREALIFTKQSEGTAILPKKRHKSMKKTKIDNYDEKRAIEFFNIKPYPGPGNYQSHTNFLTKKPESLYGWKAFAPRTHGSKISFPHIKGHSPDRNKSFEDRVQTKNLANIVIKSFFFILHTTIFISIIKNLCQVFIYNTMNIS